MTETKPCLNRTLNVLSNLANKWIHSNNKEEKMSFFNVTMRYLNGLGPKIENSELETDDKNALTRLWKRFLKLENPDDNEVKSLMEDLKETIGSLCYRYNEKSILSKEQYKYSKQPEPQTEQFLSPSRCYLSDIYLLAKIGEAVLQHERFTKRRQGKEPENQDKYEMFYNLEGFKKIHGLAVDILGVISNIRNDEDREKIQFIMDIAGNIIEGRGDRIEAYKKISCIALELKSKPEYSCPEGYSEPGESIFRRLEKSPDRPQSIDTFSKNYTDLVLNTETKANPKIYYF